MKFAVRLVAVAVAMLTAGAAQAASYPDHPVKIVVPFAPAGPTDVMARLIAQKLSESLKQQFYVENHPGAGGNIGMVQVAKSAPDGYTILVASSSFVVNPSLYAKNPYDPFKDFAPVTLAAASPNILVVNADFPAKTVKELVDLVKQSPGKYNYAMPGTGTTPHLAGELFKLTFKLDLATVPFNGAGPAIQSAVAGHTPVALTALPPTAPQVQAGKLRGLAVTSAKRSSALPDVPTMAEAGVPGMEGLASWTGMVAPAKTPDAILARLHEEVRKAVATAALRDRLTGIGVIPLGSAPAEFKLFIAAQVKQIADLARAAGIEPQ